MLWNGVHRKSGAWSCRLRSEPRRLRMALEGHHQLGCRSKSFDNDTGVPSSSSLAHAGGEYALRQSETTKMTRRPVTLSISARRHGLTSLLATALLGGCVITPGLAAAQPQDARHSAQEVAQAVVSGFDALFAGPHAGQRAVHANGLLTEGHFTPASSASSLSRAEHFAGGSVPVLVRFSNFAALPGLPDNHPAASPRGLAVKFMLPNGVDTDIVAHSYDGFPVARPDEFATFLRALPDPTRLAEFAASRPAARAFLEHPKPVPASYGTEAYFGVSAFRFENGAGLRQYGRYRFRPEAGVLHLSATEADRMPGQFLADELKNRLGRGPVIIRISVQLAVEGDPLDDGSRSWAEDRPEIEIGTLSIQRVVPAGDEHQRNLRFVPTNLVGGIAPSSDPMLTARTLSYRISADRREAGQ